MDWIKAAKALACAPPAPTCPQLEEALELVRGGHFDQAGALLETLNETQRLLATLVVELAAAETQPDPDALRALCQRLHGLAKNLVKLEDIPRDLLLVWADTVGTQLPASVVAARDAFGYGQTLLCRVVETRCKRGEPHAALPHARLINAHWRSDVAEAWTRIAFSLAEDDPERAPALMRAAQAGDARPMIQDGGEESSAHGVTMKAFAEAGLAADHPAVAVVEKGLLKLGRHRARRDVRSYGAMVASLAAGQRAAESRDAGWLERGNTLLGAIWDDGLRDRAAAALLVAEHAIEGGPPATFKTRARALLGAKVEPSLELLRALAAGRYNQTPSPESLLELQRAGVDISDRIEAAIEQWNGFGRKAVAHFVNACRLHLPDERLEAQLAKVREEDRDEALIKGAVQGLIGDPRQAAYLARGYPRGDEYGIYTRDVLHLLTPEKRLEGEDFYARSGQAEALAVLVAQALAQGQIADAARGIAKMGLPEVSDTAWVPFYRRGNRTFSLQSPVPPIAALTLDAAALKAALKTTKDTEALYQLARAVEADAPILAKVFKASRLKKWAKKSQAVGVIRLRMLEGDIEGALESLELMATGRIDDSQLGTGVRTIALALETRADLITLAQAKRILGAFSRSHPQYVTGPLIVLSRVLTAGVSPEQRDAVVEAILASTRANYRRSGDWLFAHIGIARGLARVGDIAGACASVRSAVQAAHQSNIYFKGPSLVRQLVTLRGVIPAPDYEAAASSALEACVRHESNHYAQVMQVERGLRYLWAGGDSETTLAWLANANVARIIASDIQRSIWADAEHIPDALTVLAAAWPTHSVLPEIARECVGSLALTLRRHEDPLAEAIEAIAAELAA